MPWKDDAMRDSFEKISSLEPPQVADSDLIIMAINRLERAVTKRQALENDAEFEEHITRAVEMIGWVATNVWAREEAGPTDADQHHAATEAD